MVFLPGIIGPGRLPSHGGLLIALLAAVARSAGAQATIVGTVFDSLRTLAPLRQATVVIPELSRYVTTDAQGRFYIDSVPAGRYTITFLHPILDSLDVSAEVFPITVPDQGTVTARLATPSPKALVWLVCRTTADTFPAMMLGHVRGADDSSGIAGVTVTVSWSELVLGASSPEQRTVRAVAQTRANGSYVLCGVPSAMRVEAIATVDDRSTGLLALSLGGELVGRIDFRIGLPSTRATVTGLVRDAHGTPAPNATVAVYGPSLRALTDEGGRFTLRDVPSGTQLFEAKQIGSWPRTTLVDVPASGPLDIRLALGPRAPSMPPVHALAGGNADDQTGFEERRFAGIGQFIMRTPNEKRPPASLRAFLLRAPLLFLQSSGRVQLIKMIGNGRLACVPNYFVNGYPWRSGIPGLAVTELEQVLEPAVIRGVEVYVHTAVPPFFDRRNGCGSVILWTE